jgi:two-component system, sensor histidine kinase and response regulator
MSPVLATGGSDALDKLRRAVDLGEPFDVALLDFHMPDMDGAQLAQVIADDSTLRHVQLILLSSSVEAWPDGEHARDRIVASLTKPVRQVQLLTALASVAGGHVAEIVESTIDLTEIRTGDETETNYLGRVLVAEDNPTNQRVAALQIEKFGYRVDVVSDGLEAIAAVERTDYSLVFMDCQMPELDGYAATEHIRSVEKGHTPIVAMTASALESEQRRCIEAGMDGFLSKPVSVEAIGAALLRYAVPVA